MTHQEIKDNDVKPVTGDLTALSTVAKSNLVAAINEVLNTQTSNGLTLSQKINSLAINFAQSVI